MSLDTEVAKIVMRVRQMERALHDPGPWSVTTGSHGDQWKIPARKVVGDDHVTFYAIVPMDEPMTGTDVVAAELHCGDDLVAVKLLPALEGLGEIRWTFDLAQTAVAA